MPTAKLATVNFHFANVSHMRGGSIHLKMALWAKKQVAIRSHSSVILHDTLSTIVKVSG